MKKLLLFLIATFWVTGLLKAAAVPDSIISDFEDTVYGSWHTWNGAKDTIVDNPDKSGVNTSNMVMKMDQTGHAWDGIATWSDPPMLNQKYVKILVDVYMTVSGSIQLYMDNPKSSGAATYTDSKSGIPTNTWTTLEFDISNLPAYDYKQIAFQSGLDGVYYIDNVKFIGAPEWTNFDITKKLDVKNLPSDFFASMSMKWDVDSLYLELTVKDTLIYISPSNDYLGDNIEVYLDMTNGKLADQPRNNTTWPPDYKSTANYYQLRLVPDTAFYSNYFLLANEDNFKVNGIRQYYNYNTSDSTYKFSLAMPWDSLRHEDITPAIGDTIGFDIDVSDNNGTYRNQLTWASPLLTLYRDPACWGMIKLKANGLMTEVFDTKKPTTPTNVIIDTVKTYLSDTTADLKLTWDASTDNIVVQDYIIYNGSTVLDTILAKTSKNNYTKKLKKMKNGAYTFGVAALDVSGNMSSKATASISLNTSIKGTDYTKVKISPNPVGNILNIEGQDMIKAVYVINLAGQTVISKNENAQNLKLNVSNLQSGIYMIRIQTANGTSIQKILKR